MARAVRRARAWATKQPRRRLPRRSRSWRDRSGARRCRKPRSGPPSLLWGRRSSTRAGRARLRSLRGTSQRLAAVKSMTLTAGT